jgi:hypothetical protein
MCEREESLIYSQLIYWEQNGEVRVTTNLASQIVELLRYRRPDAAFYGTLHSEGRWYYEIFAIDGDAVYIVRTWQPEPPYCWQEQEIYLVQFSG